MSRSASVGTPPLSSEPEEVSRTKGGGTTDDSVGQSVVPVVGQLALDTKSAHESELAGAEVAAGKTGYVP